jgi:hypothetical protein
MFAHRSSGKIGTAGVKATPKDQEPAIEVQPQQVQQTEETVFHPPKQKKKKLKFQRE